LVGARQKDYPTYAVKTLKNLVTKTLAGEYPPNLSALKINIKFKHLRKLRADQQQAVQRGLLWKPGSYPARIEFDGVSYGAKIRLKGDLTDHWSGDDRWSLRVRLKDGKTIMGMSRFSIQRPSVRKFPDDSLFQTWMLAVGNMAPRHEYTRIVFNGDSWGIMTLEEHMSRHLVEGNRRKESPLFKIGSESSWVFGISNKKINPGIKLPKSYMGRHTLSLYGDRLYADKPAHLAQFSHLVRRYRDALESVASPTLHQEKLIELIDTEGFSLALLASGIWQNIHGVHFSNMRLYLNPYTLKVEPVTTD
jgi:hypothetical protein